MIELSSAECEGKLDNQKGGLVRSGHVKKVCKKCVLSSDEGL